MGKSYYYNVMDDVNAYPDAWSYIVIGGRNTGKTYGALKATIDNAIKHAFVKRTIDDVALLCAGNGKIGTKVSQFGIDLSPYKSVNRDMHTNIRAFQIDKGIGAFWNCNEDNEPFSDPVGYLIALNAIQKFKGFDMSDCDWIIFDEFIPQQWERVNRKEGEQILDLYKTISRDREHRNRPPLKLIALANATQVSNPLCNILEVTDVIVDMQNSGTECYYDAERGIFIRVLQTNEEFMKVEQKSHIYKAMGNTQWGKMAFSNEFGYNDFTAIKKVNLKGYRGLIKLQYKQDIYYIYYNDSGNYIMSKSICNHCKTDYNLNRENDQKAFNLEYRYMLKDACINGRMTFESYTMYDIIINYERIFKL